MHTPDKKNPMELAAGHAHCFACGAANPHGLRLQFDADTDGSVWAQWMPGDGFRSYPDRVHGGVLATMLDSAMVHALFARGIAGVTAEMTIRYPSRANGIEPLLITAGVDSERHGVYFCHAEIRQAGIPVARATAKFMAMGQ